MRIAFAAITPILCLLPAGAQVDQRLAAVYFKEAAGPARQRVIQIVARIQRADYEGDRAALKNLHGELDRSVEDKELSSLVLYWRGFALWRRAINGFNDSADLKSLSRTSYWPGRVRRCHREGPWFCVGKDRCSVLREHRIRAARQ
jgi:hypothetical protein